MTKRFLFSIFILIALLIIGSCTKSNSPSINELNNNKPLLTIVGISPLVGGTGSLVTVSVLCTLFPDENINEIHGLDPSTIKAYFGNNAAKIDTFKNKDFTIEVPEVTGKFTIRLLVNGIYTESIDSFTIIKAHPMTVTGIAPARGVAGTEIVISGNNFDNQLAPVIVKFAGVPVNIKSKTKNEIHVIVPDNLNLSTPQNEPVIIETSDSAQSFTYPFYVTLSPFYFSKAYINVNIPNCRFTNYYMGITKDTTDILSYYDYSDNYIYPSNSYDSSKYDTVSRGNQLNFCHKVDKPNYSILRQIHLTIDTVQNKFTNISVYFKVDTTTGVTGDEKEGILEFIATIPSMNYTKTNGIYYGVTTSPTDVNYELMGFTYINQYFLTNSMFSSKSDAILNYLNSTLSVTLQP